MCLLLLPFGNDVVSDPDAMLRRRSEVILGTPGSLTLLTRVSDDAVRYETTLLGRFVSAGILLMQTGKIQSGCVFMLI